MKSDWSTGCIINEGRGEETEASVADDAAVPSVFVTDTRSGVLVSCLVQIYKRL